VPVLVTGPVPPDIAASSSPRTARTNGLPRFQASSPAPLLLAGFSPICSLPLGYKPGFVSRAKPDEHEMKSLSPPQWQTRGSEGTTPASPGDQRRAALVPTAAWDPRGRAFPQSSGGSQQRAFPRAAWDPRGRAFPQSSTGSQGESIPPEQRGIPGGQQPFGPRSKLRIPTSQTNRAIKTSPPAGACLARQSLLIRTRRHPEEPRGSLIPARRGAARGPPSPAPPLPQRPPPLPPARRMRAAEAASFHIHAELGPCRRSSRQRC